MRERERLSILSRNKHSGCVFTPALQLSKSSLPRCQPHPNCGYITRCRLCWDQNIFYDSKCRSISFFLLSFLASKVEAISCVIMSEGICIYIQAEVGTSVWNEASAKELRRKKVWDDRERKLIPPLPPPNHLSDIA